MKLSYMDILGDKKRHTVTARITTNHPDSSYGQPIIVLDSDNKALDITSWVLLNYQIVDATPEEMELRKRVLIVDPQFAAAALGRKGGLSTSEAKKKSSANNGKLGGRPKKKLTLPR
jgi:hypothetical protein